MSVEEGEIDDSSERAEKVESEELHTIHMAYEVHESWLAISFTDSFG